jgi:hypothetical protein
MKEIDQMVENCRQLTKELLVSVSKSKHLRQLYCLQSNDETRPSRMLYRVTARSTSHPLKSVSIHMVRMHPKIDSFGDSTALETTKSSRDPCTSSWMEASKMTRGRRPWKGIDLLQSTHRKSAAQGHGMESFRLGGLSRIRSGRKFGKARAERGPLFVAGSRVERHR